MDDSRKRSAEASPDEKSSKRPAPPSLQLPTAQTRDSKPPRPRLCAIYSRDLVTLLKYKVAQKLREVSGDMNCTVLRAKRSGRQPKLAFSSLAIGSVSRSE